MTIFSNITKRNSNMAFPLKLIVISVSTIIFSGCAANTDQLVKPNNVVKAKIVNSKHNDIVHAKDTDKNNHKNQYGLLILKHKLIAEKPQSQKVTTRQLKDAFKQNYKFRIATPLIIHTKKGQPLVDALLTYNKHTQLVFNYNKDAKIVGVATNKKEAKALSQTIRKVFYVLSGQTIQSTIKRWASYEHIDVIYQAKKDFKILQPATIYGSFTSTDGSLATLLGSIQNSAYPLKATFMKNNLLLIQPSTYSSNFAQS